MYLIHHAAHVPVASQVSRTHTFGRVGTHIAAGDSFDATYASMLLNQEDVNWKSMDLDFLLGDNYTAALTSWMDQAQVYNGTVEELQAYCDAGQPDHADTSDLVFKYPKGANGWTRTANHLKPMLSDVREGTPRCTYHGHAIVRCRGRRLFLRAVSDSAVLSETVSDQQVREQIGTFWMQLAARGGAPQALPGLRSGL
jgi:hypothetical protein